MHDENYNTHMPHHIYKRTRNMRTRVMLLLLIISAPLWADANLQIFYDFGSQGTSMPNQRSNRVTSTIELFFPDKWGNTYIFSDIDYSINRVNSDPQDPKNCPFGAYWEISRCLNFWQQTKASGLSIQVEYDGGLGIYGGKVVQGGYGVNHAALVGLDYFLHTADYNNTMNIKLMFKYIADDYNMWHMRSDNRWISQRGNQIPLQLTVAWTCKHLFRAEGLTFTGFFDIWGQKLNIYDSRNDCYTDPQKQSFVFLAEPQLWYSVGQWFGCPNLNIGTEIELTYNFTGRGFMCNPCLGLKWVF